MFCAFGDGTRTLAFLLRKVPTETKVCFVLFMTMPGKKILARAVGNRKRKFGVTTHLSKITERQFEDPF